MADEEDDYMSDAILASCGDVRPGLYKSTKETHQRAQEKKAAAAAKQNTVKSLKVREAETRDEALKTSLDSSNKGFALLQKMGYKPGTAIGKSGEGRLEPVGIEVKANRSGLGQEAEKRRREERRREEVERRYEKRARAAQQLQSSYRSGKISEQRERRLERDLRQSQAVCEQLDASKSLKEPAKSFYWPKHLLPTCQEGAGAEEEAEEEEEELDITTIGEQLTELTDYLRSTYFYCVWCGYSCDDYDQLLAECPGSTAEDHDE